MNGSSSTNHLSAVACATEFFLSSKLQRAIAGKKGVIMKEAGCIVAIKR
jgi:hypothetical protein